jgi:N-methylhydantoinase B
VSGASDGGGAQAFAGLCAEMSAGVASGSESATLSDLLIDPGAAICDDRGRVLACTSIRHLAPFAAVGAAAAAGWAFPTAGESVVLLNDPFGGGTRVLDFYAVHPVEVNGAERRWMTVARCTAADLGGNCFGGYNPTATEVWAEGARITPLRVYEGGSWARETLACVTLNSRTPSLLAAQLRAMISAVTAAGVRLAALVGELGDEPASIAARHLEAAGERAERSLPEPPAAGWGAPASMPVRSGDGEERGQVTVQAQRRDGRIVLDLSASTAACGGYTNATRPTTVSAALAALFASAPEGPPPSDALLGAVDVITRPASIVDAAYPAPTVCGELTVASAVRDAVAAALSGAALREVAPDRGILGADGRLAEDLAQALQADEARAASAAEGGQAWR